MGRRNADAAGRHRFIKPGDERCGATTLLDDHAGAIGNTGLRQRRGIHPRRSARRRRASLQRRGTARQHVGKVDRHVGNARQTGGRSGHRGVTSLRPLSRPAANSALAEMTVSRTASLLMKSKPETEHVTEHAQDLPARTGFAQRATTPLKPCTRPSALTKVPEVSVKGAIGSSASAVSAAALSLNGVRTTVNAACFECGGRELALWHRVRARLRARRKPYAAGPAFRGIETVGGRQHPAT